MIRARVTTLLAPGDYVLGGHGGDVCTLLGSCVAMALWHPPSRVGALSHSLLARRQSTVSAALDARYVEDALELMLRALARRGIAARDCRAKVFGGGDMFGTAERGHAPTVGQRNGEAALTLLQASGIPVVACCLYGAGHRALRFELSTGDVWLRRHSRTCSTSEPGRGVR
ncbi:MAG: chemotaxis protein CheD [Pelomonas sp.]|nr:chemotaxis protein CheD [Roseateles sp.]